MGLPGTAATHVSWYNSQKSIWQHLLRLDAYTAYPGDPTSTDTPGGGNVVTGSPQDTRAYERSDRRYSQQPKLGTQTSSITEQINKLWPLHTTEHHAAPRGHERPCTHGVRAARLKQGHAAWPHL